MPQVLHPCLFPKNFNLRYFQSECRHRRMSGSATKLKKKRRPSVSPLTTNTEIEAHRSLERWVKYQMMRTWHMVGRSGTKPENSERKRASRWRRDQCLLSYPRTVKSRCRRRSSIRRRLPATMKEGELAEERSHRQSPLRWWPSPGPSMYNQTNLTLS